MTGGRTLLGSYQEALRVIGAWLDVRGLQNVSIIEKDGELYIEAAPAATAAQRPVEQFRLDRESIERLCHAARKDRGSHTDASSRRQAFRPQGI